MGYFSDKHQWALVIGGSSGIGLETARKLASEGLNLFIVHRDRRSTLLEAEKHFETMTRDFGIQLVSFNKDATSKENIALICEEIQEHIGSSGSIKLLLHSVARGNLKALVKNAPEHSIHTQDQPTDLETQVNEFFKLQDSVIQDTVGELEMNDYQFTIHAMGVNMLEWAKAILKLNKFSFGARIIGLTSEGDKKVWKGYGAVAAAKAALEAISKYLAVELAPFGITSNLIQAGVTPTPSMQMIPGSDILMATAINRNPFKRLTTPEDVANVIYLMTRDESQWINGTTIIADGGENLV